MLAYQVGAVIDDVQPVDAAVDGQRGILERVLVRVRLEGLDRKRGQLYRVGAGCVGFFVEHAFCGQALRGFGEQRAPVVAELPEKLAAYALVSDGVDVVLRAAEIVDRVGGVRRLELRLAGNRVVIGVMYALVGRLADESARLVVDVAAAVVVIDHHARRQLVLDDRNVEGEVRIAACRAVFGAGAAAIEGAAERLEIRFVGDVAQHAGLCAGAEQRALRSLQYFDPVQVHRVDVQVMSGHLGGLIVEVDRDVGEGADAAAALAALVTADAEAAYEYVLLAGAEAGERHIGKLANQVIEVLDIQALQRGAAEGLYGDRHILQLLHPALRGDGDHFGRIGLRCRVLLRGGPGLGGRRRRGRRDVRRGGAGLGCVGLRSGAVHLRGTGQDHTQGRTGKQGSAQAAPAGCAMEILRSATRHVCQPPQRGVVTTPPNAFDALWTLRPLPKRMASFGLLLRALEPGQDQQFGA